MYRAYCSRYLLVVFTFFFFSQEFLKFPYSYLVTSGWSHLTSRILFFFFNCISLLQYVQQRQGNTHHYRPHPFPRVSPLLSSTSYLSLSSFKYYHFNWFCTWCFFVCCNFFSRFLWNFNSLFLSFFHRFSLSLSKKEIRKKKK